MVAAAGKAEGVVAKADAVNNLLVGILVFVACVFKLRTEAMKKVLVQLFFV